MIIDYNKLKRYVYRKAPNGRYYCCKCGGELDYCYLESEIYCVRCEDCQTHTLVRSKAPYLALGKVGENG